MSVSPMCVSISIAVVIDMRECARASSRSSVSVLAAPRLKEDEEEGSWVGAEVSLLLFRLL